MFAQDLGITGADLAKNDRRGVPAVGQAFDIWSPAGIAVTGQVMVPRPDEKDFEPWGPMFAMDIAFAETDETALLLGQSDFFQAFDLNFRNQAGGSFVEICECAPPPRGP